MASSSDRSGNIPSSESTAQVPPTRLSTLIARDRNVGQVLAQFVRHDSSTLNQLDAEHTRVKAVQQAHKLVTELTTELSLQQRFAPLTCILQAILREDDRPIQHVDPKPIPYAVQLPTLHKKCINTPLVQGDPKSVPRKLHPVGKVHSIFRELSLTAKVPPSKSTSAVNKRFHTKCSACDIFRSRLVPTHTGYRVEPSMDKLCLLAHLKFNKTPGFKEINTWLASFRITFDLKLTVQTAGKKNVTAIATPEPEPTTVPTFETQSEDFDWYDQAERGDDDVSAIMDVELPA